MRLRLTALPLLLVLACAKSPTPAPQPQPQPTPKSPQGAACSVAGDCATGICADAVCCAAACGATEVCNDLQHVGVCFGRRLGAECSGDGQCPSGHCTDGVCCEAACGQGESCAAPGFQGHCHGKALGEACQGDSQCPSGHCADGVCCDAACVGGCLSCNQAGAVGHCQVVPDGEDPRKACGRCEGCFAGTCGPALPGTDPNGACSAGQVCSAAQSCAAATGGACTQDSDCAQNSCIGGQCLPVSEETLFAPPMSTNATLRNPEGLVSAAGGRTFALFTETNLSMPYDPYSDQTSNILRVSLKVAALAPGSGWRAAELQGDTCTDYYGYTPSALVALGASAYAVAYSQVATMGYTCNQSAATPPGVYGTLIGPAGDPAGHERIDPSVRVVHNIAAGVEANGAVVAAFIDLGPSGDDGGSPLQVWERVPADGGHAWSPVGSWSNTAASLAVAQGPEPVVVWVDRDGGYYDDPVWVRARRKGDAQATPVALQAGGAALCCEQPYVYGAASAPEANPAFMLYCHCRAGSDGYYLGQVSTEGGALAVSLQAVPGSAGAYEAGGLALADGGALFGVVDLNTTQVSLSLAGGASGHPVVQAGPGVVLRPDVRMAPGRSGESLLLVGRAATATGASADLGLLHLGP